MRPLLLVVLLFAIPSSSGTSTTDLPNIQMALYDNEAIWTPYPQTLQTPTRPTTPLSTSTMEQLCTLHGLPINCTRLAKIREQQWPSSGNVEVWTSPTNLPTPTTSMTVDPLAAGLLRPTAAETRPSTSTEDPIAAGLLHPTAAQTRRPTSTADPLAAGLLRSTSRPMRWGCWDEPSAAGAVRVDFLVLLLVLLYALLC
ncbi:hypothetical protein M3Y99_00916000 [Aphelenchoides fujianensis]|nr:hypothetical protein M3Y99_00916000 [Aphelenchoides fujianensis]